MPYASVSQGCVQAQGGGGQQSWLGLASKLEYYCCSSYYVTHPIEGDILQNPVVINNHLLLQGVCKTRTGYLRMADADGKMRIEKCGQHKADGKMLINQKTKNKTRKCRQHKRKKLANKHKKKRNLSFKWMSYGWALHVQNTLSLVGTSYPRFFSLFFETCSAFH